MCRCAGGPTALGRSADGEFDRTAAIGYQLASQGRAAGDGGRLDCSEESALGWSRRAVSPPPLPAVVPVADRMRCNGGIEYPLDESDGLLCDGEVVCLDWSCWSSASTGELGGERFDMRSSDANTEPDGGRVDDDTND